MSLKWKKSLWGDEFSYMTDLVKLSFRANWIATKKLGAKCFKTDSLRRGAGVNVQDDNGYTPLHHACLRSHKEIVQLLLSVDASPCVLDKKGANPLHLAAWKGDVDIVNMLLAHSNPRVDINQQTSDQETAVLIAARSGYVQVVEVLIAHGADVTIKNIKDESALDLAAFFGRLETVQLLLRVRPDLVDQYKYPRCRGRVFPSTPLHRAIKNGHKEVVKALINAGVDPNVRTHNGTPLHEAACYGRAPIVRILLSKRADLHAVDRRGKTVYDLLADYSEEATREIKKVIKEFENISRNPCDSEDDLPPFPVQDYSPTGYPNSVPMKAPETQKNTNLNVGLLSPSSSSSSITKNHPQSFVKKLASKCLGLKAKFNSAPNISNSAGLESVEVKLKNADHKSANTLLIGNSKFFNKILSKKEESGEVVCNDEFDTISLDRLGTLNRDSSVNRSNRSCPGFKTSLPNISENTELSDHESLADSVIITEIDCDNSSSNDSKITEAVNSNPKLNIFEPRNKSDRQSITSNASSESANLLNEYYESYEVSKTKQPNVDIPKPVPPPRPTVAIGNNNTIYENVTIDNKVKPVPAARIHVPPKIPLDEVEKKVVYENIGPLREKTPDPLKRTVVPIKPLITDLDDDRSTSMSRTSTLSSSDSLIDESNLEDILLSEKSKSFRHSKKPALYPSLGKVNDPVSRTISNASELSDVTQASAIENVDCTGDVNDKSIYLSMTGTLPNKKTVKKKVLFRHKTFTNIEADRNSTNVKDLPKWDSDFLKETLPNYHIRGTGHCMYKAPTVKEFIYIFNRETLYKDVEPFTKVPNDKRDSYYETAICFCRPKPPKHHNSCEDLLDKGPQQEEASVSIDLEALKNKHDMKTSSFRCFCDSGDCKLHNSRKESLNELVVKFSVIKKSISTPDITLDYSPNSTTQKAGLHKIQSVPSLEEPYAVVTLENIIARNKQNEKTENSNEGPTTPVYTTMSNTSTLTSGRPYSIKDISDVISLNDSLPSADASLNRACGVPLRKSSSSEHSGHWSLQSCNSNVTIKSDASFKTCYEDSEEDSDDTLHSDDASDAETVKSDISTAKRPWVHSDSFRFGSKDTKSEMDIIAEESKESDSKFESGISVGSESSSESDGDQDSGVPRADDVSLGAASLERGTGVVRGVRSGSGRRRWDEAEGMSEGDALSVSSAASSCAPLHMTHHHEYSKVSPTPPKKPPRRNLSVSPTHANSPSSGYSYELRAHARSQDDLDDIQETGIHSKKPPRKNLSVSPTHANSPSSGYSYELRAHARSQDDLDDIQGAKHYLKHGRSVDQYVDGKLSYSEYEENHNTTRVPPIPNPRPSLQKNRTQPVAITAMYENVVIKEQNPRRKLRRNNLQNYDPENRVRKYSHQEKSSLESLLDDASMNSPSDCEGLLLPSSPTHYDQPPTPDHPPPSARQAENSIHERIRPLSQLIMEEYKRRSALRDSYTETDICLLRAASAASVASGATDRSGNTDNCVEEYVCDVPFAVFVPYWATRHPHRRRFADICLLRAACAASVASGATDRSGNTDNCVEEYVCDVPFAVFVPYWATRHPHRRRYSDICLLRAASAASVASGATDRSGNTDNCVEEYVCDVPFAVFVPYWATRHPHRRRFADICLLRAACAASVASGATDRSGNTDNCVEEYVCDVPFAGESYS
ncbi:ankyrin repeats (3 copies) domain-containing protein [Phthorimaea operculella]|nr:ankyrin repeats (3 copies) domain-containing protein [Phthorimaea operculella]